MSSTKEAIYWNVIKTKVSDLKEFDKNPRKLTKKGLSDLKKSIEKFGVAEPIVVNKDFTIIGGHGRKKVLKEMKIEEVDCYFPDRILDPKEVEELCVRLNKNIAGEFDFDILANEFEIDELIEWGFDEGEFGIEELEPETEGDDDVPESAPSITVKGDLYELGGHRLVCGDSTMIDDVEKLMGGAKSSLLHADPPYGMGKEKDGVLNDNLYNEDLDKFQMDWWLAFRPFLESNAAAYIWGNAPDLWRLWYVGGLQESEELEIANHIVWDKKTIPGMKSSLMTQYPIATEHCLFIKLGDQLKGSINAEDYWEGWDQLRLPLFEEAQRLGVTRKVAQEICGCDMYSHWFSTSQWTLIPEKHYTKLAERFKDQNGFSKPWKEIKKLHLELLKGSQSDKTDKRAYFDNAHDIMHDVWTFDRVHGEERQGHATPKPVDMVVRIVKSSSIRDAIVIEPFLGSGSTLIGCEKANRKCYGMELDERYCDIVVRRYINFCNKNGRTPTVKRNGEDCLKEFESEVIDG